MKELQINVPYTPKQIRAWCAAHGYDNLVARIAEYEHELDLFESDGCTWWPDEYKHKSYRHCCIKHDIEYWVGGTQDDRFMADLELAICVCPIAGYKWAEDMLVGVRTGNWIGVTFRTGWRWGYGRIKN